MRYRSSAKKDINPLEPPCRKAIYNTREDAEDVIRHISDTRGGKEIRAYKCDICGFWHLTSKGRE